jgi:RimJ/RimL family protein N-acetyltransferase
MYFIKQITKDEWKLFSENAHCAIFEKHKNSNLEKCDFAILFYENEKSLPLGFITCKELDSETLYYQYGGLFKDFRGKGFSTDLFKEISRWCHEKYKYVGFRVENTNLPMLKLAMNAGYKIVGIRNFHNYILLEHLLERENAV